MKEYISPMADNRRWAGSVHRPGDIFVCTPPKCGTTWMQAIVNSLLFPDGTSPAPVWDLSPWLEAKRPPIEEVLARLDAQTHRRCIKTHTAADGIPWFDDCHYIYVGRDGRDAFMSWVNHSNNMRRDVFDFMPPKSDAHEMLPGWLEGGGIFHNVATYWEKRGQDNLLFTHYSDLKADLEAEMRRVAAFLAIEVPDAKWPAVVERCTFSSMKDRHEEIGDFSISFEGGADAFLFKGTNERWRGVLADEELATIDARAAELLPPDAIAWLRR